jgi:replicative DNA helicase
MLKHSQIAKILQSELNKNRNEGDKELTQEELTQFLETYKRADRIVRSDELSALVDKEGIRPGMKTHVDDLDTLIGGFYEEQVIIVSAYPKSGKTSYCLFTIDKMKEQNPLFLALEQSPRELVEHLKIRKMDVPMFYCPESIEGVERTTDWIHLKIIESQYRSQKETGTPTKLVVIDHFGYIFRARSSDQATWDIINTMQELKEIAKQTKTAIMVIVHTTKGDETEPPTTKDLFGSAGYHQEADTVLSLWRETYKDKKSKKTVKTANVLLQVLANRKWGDTGAIKFKFDNGKFVREDWVGKHESASEVQADKDFADF